MTAGAGLALPELVIEVTPTFVIAAAIGTRDFQDVHHDRDRAVARGGKDIFVNILTTMGLVQRYVTDWAGPEAIVRRIAIRLGVPCYAGDKLAFSGRAVPAPGDDQTAGTATQGGRASPGDGREYLVEVTGRCSLGDHVTGTVHIRAAEPGGSAAAGPA